jgi:hypothetical protein
MMGSGARLARISPNKKTLPRKPVDTLDRKKIIVRK